ncbi:imidazole glycerol phosphate synthase subunit HisH, partial [Planococcus sp. SIMBA_160]
SFADAMDNLWAGGWVGAVQRFAHSGRPTLGICLGMQLFFEGSEEEAPQGELVKGIGLVTGVVRRLTVDREPHRLKVPHMGWNRLEWT